MKDGENPGRGKDGDKRPKRDWLHIEPQNKHVPSGNNVTKVDFMGHDLKKRAANARRPENDPANLQNVEDARAARLVFLEHAEVYGDLTEYLHIHWDIWQYIQNARKDPTKPILIKEPFVSLAGAQLTESVYEPLARLFSPTRRQDEGKVKKVLQDWLFEQSSNDKTMVPVLQESQTGALIIQWKQR